MHGLKEIAVAQILRVNLTEMNLSVQSLFNPGCNLRHAQIQTFFQFKRKHFENFSFDSFFHLKSQYHLTYPPPPLKVYNFSHHP